MSTSTVPAQIKAILFLLGVPHEYYGETEHYLTGFPTIADCDVTEENWRVVAEVLSNSGAHISYFDLETHAPSMIFIFEIEDPTEYPMLKKFPPYTFKA